MKFRSYRYQMETIIGQYTVKIYDNHDILLINIMGNHNPESISPFGVPYFGLSLEDFSNMDNKDYIPREYKFCRISMLEPKILGMEDENFIPSKEHIELMWNWFNNPYRYEWFDGTIDTNESGWRQLIDEMNYEPAAYKNPVNLPIPNYLEMKL